MIIDSLKKQTNLAYNTPFRYWFHYCFPNTFKSDIFFLNVKNVPYLLKICNSWTTITNLKKKIKEIKKAKNIHQKNKQK